MAALSPHPGARLAASGARRVRYGVRAAVIMLCATAVGLFAMLMANQTDWQLDLSNAAHTPLSPRTHMLLERLQTDHEIIVAANLREVDPVALQQVRDALEAMHRASARLNIAILDASAGGGSDYDAVLRRLVDRSADRVASVTQTLDSAREACTRQAEFLRGLIASYEEIREGLPLGGQNLAERRAFLDNKIAVARVTALDLEQAAGKAADAMRQTVGATPLPPLDQAERQLSVPLASLANEYSTTQQMLTTLAGQADADLETKSRCMALAHRLGEQRDLAARAADSLQTLAPLPVLAVARTLEARSAAIVVGGKDGNAMTAVDLEPILPGRGVYPANLPRPNVRTRSEDLFAAAIASLDAADRPIAVLLHGEGITIGPEFEPFAALVRRLSLRGVEVVEWAAALSPSPPEAQLRRLGADRGRPVVYLALSTSASSPEAAVRMRALAGAVKSMVDAGQPVLVSVNPSMLPGIGQKDPLVEVLEPFGLNVDSGRPILRAVNSSQGPSVAAEFLLVPSPGASAGSDAQGDVLNAIVGIPTQILWPIPIRTTPVQDVAVRPLLTIADDDQTWAESEWTRFRQTPAAQRALLADQPREDSSRDDGNGPWTVAVTATRPIHGAVQRIIVVGSNGWFLDSVTQQARSVEGRVVAACPGNLELLDAAVFYLAGQDEWIARGAPAVETPLIMPLSSGQMRAIWWLLVGVLPAGVLLLGLAIRLVRR